MRNALLLAASAVSLAWAVPASAQGMMMGGDMGMAGKSCVQNGAFVPCTPPPTMQMGMEGPGMDGRRMSRREMRMQRRMMMQDQKSM